MMKGFLLINLFSYFFGSAFVFGYDHSFCRNRIGQLINPVVRKNTNIQKTFSVNNGAEPIGGERIVEDATECYSLCCNRYDTAGCNLAQMHYRQSTDIYGQEHVIKSCYLYACGSPSRCLLDSNSLTMRYHAILLQPDESDEFKNSEETTTLPPPTTTTAAPIATTTTTSSTSSKMISNTAKYAEEACPPGVPVALCSNNPCEVNECPGNPRAVCKWNACGGCNAKFYTEKGEEADCSLPDASGLVSNHNEQSVTVNEDDYEETPSERLPPMKSMTQKEKEKQDKLKDGKDYYQPERRKWLDGEDKDQGIIDEGTKKPRTTDKSPPRIILKPVEVVHVNSSFSVPLLIALLVCIALLMFMVYRYWFSRRGKPKKFNVDDGDYLINGMYL